MPGPRIRAGERAWTAPGSARMVGHCPCWFGADSPMHLRLSQRPRFARALATLACLLATVEVRAASKVQIAAIGDQAPGSGQFLGPGLTGTPAAAGNG